MTKNGKMYQIKRALRLNLTNKNRARQVMPIQVYAGYQKRPEILNFVF